MGNQEIKKIYDLGLFEGIGIKEWQIPFAVYRVPGGWVFLFPPSGTPCFVPFNNEFQEKPKPAAKKPIRRKKTKK